MLVALYKNNKIFARDINNNENNFICPHCNKKVSYVREHLRSGCFVIPHFRHLIPCPFESEPETAIHLRMKLYFYDKLNEKGFKTEIEKRMMNRIADVYAEKNNLKIVVECQNSNISLDNLVNRTKDYNRLGIYVFWIFSTNKYFNIDKSGYIKIKTIEKILHKLNYGRVYYFDKESIIAINFSSAGTIIDNEWTGNSYYKFYKTLKNYKKLVLTKWEINTFENEGYKLLRLNDRVFWK